MKRLLSLIVALGLLAAAGAIAQDAKDDFNGQPAANVGPGAGQGWFGPNRGSVLFDNGPLVNSVGTGAGGADESVLQSTSLAMNTLGFGHQVSFDNRIADDFTVDGGGWQIDTITFFAYQTGSTTTSTINGVNVNIWDGVPAAPGSSIVFTTAVSDGGGLSTSWSGIYRVTETTGGANNRPIMANVVTIGTFLTPGTYWLDWQSNGTLTSGPWAPPVTINGQATTGNALQSLDGGLTFPAANDSGTLTQQAFPFIIEGAPPCQIDSMSIAANQITINGQCPVGVDLYYEGPNGAIVFVQGGIIVNGSTTVTLGSVAPDSIYFVTAVGDSTRLAQTTRTVPTLGEWGLMAFVLLLMVAGIYFMKKRRMAY